MQCVMQATRTNLVQQVMSSGGSLQVLTNPGTLAGENRKMPREVRAGQGRGRRGP